MQLSRQSRLDLGLNSCSAIAVEFPFLFSPSPKSVALATNKGEGSPDYRKKGTSLQEDLGNMNRMDKAHGDRSTLMQDHGFFLAAWLPECVFAARGLLAITFGQELKGRERN